MPIVEDRVSTPYWSARPKRVGLLFNGQTNYARRAAFVKWKQSNAVSSSSLSMAALGSAARSPSTRRCRRQRLPSMQSTPPISIACCTRVKVHSLALRRRMSERLWRGRSTQGPRPLASTACGRRGGVGGSVTLRLEDFLGANRSSASSALTIQSLDDNPVDGQSSRSRTATLTGTRRHRGSTAGCTRSSSLRPVIRWLTP